MKKLFFAVIAIALFSGWGCGPSLTSKYWNVRQLAVKELTDQKRLTKIALEDESGNVRSTAAGKLTDQAILTRIALQDKEWHVRSTAVKKLSDQELLGKIALQDKDFFVRKAAVETITNQPILARVAIEYIGLEDTTYSYLAGDIVERLTDQDLLGKIALQDKCYDWLRDKAVNKLNDQEILAKVVLESLERNDTIVAAVMRLSDQAVLAKVALQDKHEHFRNAAVRNITDQAVLARIAFQDEEAEVRSTAVKKINDQAVLARIAIQDKNKHVRRAALGTITDQNTLKKLLESGDVTTRAIARLNFGLRDPRIIQRLGSIRLDIVSREKIQQYSSSPQEYSQHEIYRDSSNDTFIEGDDIEVNLQFEKDGHSCTHHNEWRTSFPLQVWAGTTFIPADVDIEPIFSKLFESPAFTCDDFVELTHSVIPEVREAAQKAAQKPAS